MNNLSNNVVEIFCDASIKKFPNQRCFGSAGAISRDGRNKIQIMPDSTNNKSEITAIYLAVQLAKEIVQDMHEEVTINIYSDSKISVYGLKFWMNKWVEMMYNGVLYTPQGDRVKNQEIFIQIYDFLARNNLKINLYHCKGHVNVMNEKQMVNAANVFYESNGFMPDRDLLTRVSFYNDKIDNLTRNYLSDIDPNMTNTILDNSNGEKMYHYVLPVNWKDYIS